MRNRKLLWYCTIAVVILVMISAVHLLLKAQHFRDVAVQRRARREHLPIPVRTVAVTQKNYVKSIGATAVTVPSLTASIWVGTGVGLRDTGVRIKAVHTVEGQEVQLGQLLFELDDELFAQAVKRHEVALAAAKAQLRSIRLLRREKAATGLQLRDAELQLELARLDLQMAQRDRQRCQVLSPTRGFADIVTVALGEEVNTGREFTKIHRLDPIHLRVDFPQERLDDVFIGQDAEVVLDSFPQDTFSARVIRIAPQADPETRVLPVVLEMENASHRIRAGLTGFARLRVHREVLVIPKTSLVKRGTHAMVFRVDQDQSKIQDVKLGDQVDIGTVEVVAGLHLGDEVVVYGSEFLRDGDQVDVHWRQWARRN